MRKSAMTIALAFLLMSIILPTFLVSNAKADDNGETLDVDVEEPNGNNQWYKIKTDLITILFPAGGKKPMFLWWYSNDTNNIYVVKYKGLIEYMAIDYPYYMHKYNADNLTMRERLEAKYAGMGPYRSQIMNKIGQYLFGLLNLHPAFLPFSSCRWNLTGPVNVTRGDGVSYIAFNFTLVDAPHPIFDFAEDNVIIRCRFYATDATETAPGPYNYTVHAGELKMDLVVKNWKWNIDRLTGLFTDLHDEFNITVPTMRAGLALWVDLASINVLDIAEQDANSSSDIMEAHSTTSDVIADGQRVQVRENRTAMGFDEAPIPVRNRVRERFRLQFAKGSQALAGFFEFVDKAAVVNETSGTAELVNVTAAYISAGAHMRLFIGYPYFGANTLEHDPSIGVENVVPWLPANLLTILIAATIAIAVAVAAVKMRKKPINIVNIH